MKVGVVILVTLFINDLILIINLFINKEIDWTRKVGV